MKKTIAFLLSLLVLTGCSKNAGQNTYRQISQQEAMEIMNTQSDIIILDVRTEEEYLAGHIAGAVNLPNEDINSQNLALLPEKDQTILVYCRSGNRSKQASGKLADLGYTEILEFGGINTWQGPVE